MFTILKYKKTKKKFKIPYDFNMIRKYCKKNNSYIKVLSDNKVEINEYVLRNVIGIPSTYIKTNKKNKYNISTILKQIKRSHPHFVDIQEYLGIKVRHTKKFEVPKIAEILKKADIGKIGRHNMELPMEDGKKYRPDYTIWNPCDKNKVLILIEYKEAYHKNPDQIIEDDTRERELEIRHGTKIIEFFEDDTDSEFNEKCDMIKKILDVYKKNYLVDEMKKEMGDEFSLLEDFGINIDNILDRTNIFHWSLDKIKEKLQILKDSNEEKKMMSYFKNDVVNISNNDIEIDINSDEDQDDINSDDENDINSDDENDINSDYESEMDDVDENIEITKKSTRFIVGEDFIVRNKEIFVKREVVIEISLKTDTIIGKKIFNQLMKYEKMLRKMFEIDMERRKNLWQPLNERSLRRVYFGRIKKYFENKIKISSINYKKKLDKYLIIIKSKDDEIEKLKKELKSLKES